MIARIALICIAWCSSGQGAVSPEPLIDLKPALLANAGLTRMDVTRRGRRMDSVVMVAPASAMVPLSAFNGRGILRMTVAPVFNIGDGFDFRVSVSGPTSSRIIHMQSFDPGRRARDRDWITVEVPITVRQGERVLEMQLSGGDQGDLVDDWLALARVELYSAEVKR